jgi:hypothetical protein
LNPVPDPVPGQGFDDQKFKKYGTAEKNIFFEKKNAIYLFWASLKDVQAALKREHSISSSKNEIFNFFLFLWVIFALLDPEPIHNTG